MFSRFLPSHRTPKARLSRLLPVFLSLLLVLTPLGVSRADVLPNGDTTAVPAVAPSSDTIFFTVDYLIEGEESANAGRSCGATRYRLKIVMEGVGVPNQLGELSGVTIVADLEIVPGGGLSWTAVPPATHSYAATVKLLRVPTPDGKALVYPLMVQPVPATPDFTWQSRCVHEDGTVVEGPVNLDPAEIINNFHGFVLAAGGMKEVEPGEFLSKFYAFDNSNGLRRIEQRVWWGDRRLPTLTVEPDVEGVFLSQVPSDVNVTYDPRWADDVNTTGAVWVKLGPGQWIKRSQPAPQKFIETIPLGNTPPTNKPIEGWAQLDNNNRQSQPQRREFTVAPPPTIVRPDEVTASKNGAQKSITYKVEHNMPPIPFQKQWNIPSWFPAPLKGKDTTIKAQLKLIDEHESTAVPATHINKLGFEGELEVGHYSGKLSIEGTANIEYSATGLKFLNGQGKADLQIGIKETVGPFDLVPTLKPLASAVELDSWLEQYAKIEAGIFIFGAGDVKIEEGANGLDWQAVVLSGVRPIFKYQLGKDESYIRFEVEAKGEARLKFHLNIPKDDLFQGGEGELTFSAALAVLHCKWSREVKYMFSSVGAAELAAGMEDAHGACGSDPNDRALAAEVWTAATGTALSAFQNPTALTAVSTTLVSQVMVDAAPSVDGQGNTLCWVQRRAAAPEASNTEIVCARGGLTAFTPPVAVTNDTYADASPSVALAAADSPIVTWWHHDDPSRPLTATLDANFFSHGQIVASAFNKNNQQWSSPVTFGSAEVLDYAPLAVGNAVGGALIAWRSNSANHLGGFGDTPDNILVARYNPASQSWGNTELIHTAPGLVAMTAAYGANEAALLYVIDQDQNPATPNDSELYAQRLVGGSWQPIVRLTNNSVADYAAKLAYQSDGTPVIVWLQQDQAGQPLLAYQEGWAGTAAFTTMSATNTPTQLASLALNSAGDAIVVWRNHYDRADGAAQGDLTFALRPAATGVWSTPLRLTADSAYERAASVIWNGNNRFNTLYQTIGDGGNNTIQLFQQPISAADASVSATDLLLDPPNPAPGAPVTATITVRNLGMLPQSNVNVSFVEQNLADASLVRSLGAQTIPLLRGGEAISLSVPYHSAQGANGLTVALSCGGVCGVASNDQVTVVVNRANLVLNNAGVVNTLFGPIVRAYVSNQGVVGVPMVAMTVTAALPEGERLLGSTFFQMNSDTGVQPGAQVVGEFALPLDLAVGSVPLTVTVAPAFAQPEGTLQDNHKTLLWSPLPDLALNGNFADLRQQDGQSNLMLTVFNQGYLPSVASTVSVYSADPTAGGTLIGSTPVDALAAYGQTELSLTLPGGLASVWLRVNAEASFAESNRANNDAFVGLPDTTGATEASYRLLLPLVRR
jgi:hypothetical protein